MIKWSMHKYDVRGLCEHKDGGCSCWKCEVNAVNANNAKAAARANPPKRFGRPVRLTKISAKRVGAPSFVLSGWKEV